MHQIKCFALGVGVATLLGAGTLRAEVGSYPVEVVKRPLSLNQGMAEIRGDLTMSLSRSRFMKPAMLAPSGYYGVTDALTLGLVHERSVCLSDGCIRNRFYDQVGVEGLYTVLSEEKFVVAPRAGLFVETFDPFSLALRMGARVLYRPNPDLGIYFDPHLGFGITSRATGYNPTSVFGNKEYIALPVRVALQVTDQLTPYVETGLVGGFSDFGDVYRIPLGGGVIFAVNNQIDFGASFTFTHLLGGDLWKLARWDGIDSRELALFGRFRF